MQSWGLIRFLWLLSTDSLQMHTLIMYRISKCNLSRTASLTGNSNFESICDWFSREIEEGAAESTALESSKVCTQYAKSMSCGAYKKLLSCILTFYHKWINQWWQRHLLWRKLFNVAASWTMSYALSRIMGDNNFWGWTMFWYTLNNVIIIPVREFTDVDIHTLKSW